MNKFKCKKEKGFKRVLIILLSSFQLFSSMLFNNSTRVYPEGLVESNVEELGSHIYSFTIKLGDSVFKVPFKYQDLVDKGWTRIADEEEVKEVSPNFSTPFIRFEKDGVEISVIFSNLTSADTIPLEECYGTGVFWFNLGKLDDNKESESNSNTSNSSNGTSNRENGAKSKGKEVELPLGITNLSSKEDLLKAYGEPSEIEKRSNGYEDFRYEIVYNSLVIVTFDDKGIIRRIEMDNISDILDEKGEKLITSGFVTGKIPKEILEYKRPDKISNNYLDYSFKVKDEIYSLPVPVNIFLNDGWTIIGGHPTLKSMQSDYSAIYLMKENKRLKVILRNYSSKEQNKENTWVTSVSPDGSRFREGTLPIEIFSGIQNGMEEEDLLKIIKDLPYDKSDYSDFVLYTIKENFVQYYEVSVNKTSGQVSHIRVSMEPNSLNKATWR